MGYIFCVVELNVGLILHHFFLLAFKFHHRVGQAPSRLRAGHEPIPHPGHSSSWFTPKFRALKHTILQYLQCVSHILTSINVFRGDYIALPNTLRTDAPVRGLDLSEVENLIWRNYSCDFKAKYSHRARVESLKKWSVNYYHTCQLFIIVVNYLPYSSIINVDVRLDI